MVALNSLIPRARHQETRNHLQWPIPKLENVRHFSPLRFAYLILSKCGYNPFSYFWKETKDSLINWNYCGHQNKELRLNNIKPIFNMKSQNLRKGCKQLCFGPFRASGNKSLYWPLVFFVFKFVDEFYMSLLLCKQHTYYIRIVAFLKGKCFF